MLTTKQAIKVQMEALKSIPKNPRGIYISYNDEAKEVLLTYDRLVTYRIAREDFYIDMDKCNNVGSVLTDNLNNHERSKLAREVCQFKHDRYTIGKLETEDGAIAYYNTALLKCFGKEVIKLGVINGVYPIYVYGNRGILGSVVPVRYTENGANK